MASLYSDLLYFSCLISWEHYSKFGEGKRFYGLGLVMTRLQDTCETVIAMQLLVLNLERKLRILLVHFFSWLFSSQNWALCCGYLSVQQPLIRDYVFDAGSYGDYVDHELTTVFPSVLINKTGVPAEIANAFDAAVKTKGIEPAICLLSLRRVLEMIAKNMDAKGETLEKKIEFLVEKKALPEMLNDACWIIRKMGNAAAHADDIKVHAYDVDKVIEYVAVIIEYLYSLPKRIKDAKAKIEQEG